jgi:DHA1 family tetracycline resistance protein-like MFS transporter
MGRPLLVVFLTVVLDLVGFGIVVPLLTFYAESFDATPEQVTSLMTVYSLAQFVAAPLWGQASDRFGRRPTLLISILLTAAMLAGFASATSLWVLFLFRGLHGVMTANVAIAQACVADLTTPETRARGMGLIGAAFGIGFTVGPFIGGELASISLTAPIWCAAALSVLNFALGVIFLPETRQRGGESGARPISPRALVEALSDPVVGLCIGLTFVYILAFAAMESTFTLFAKHDRGLQAQDVGRLFGSIGVIGAVVQGGVVHRLVKRFGEARLIGPGMVCLAFGLALLPLVPVGLPLLAAFAIVAVGQGIASPTLQSLISRGASADEQGRIMGSNQSMGALARAVGPLIGGGLFARVGHPTPFYASAGLLLAATALSVPAVRRATSRSPTG